VALAHSASTGGQRIVTGSGAGIAAEVRLFEADGAATGVSFFPFGPLFESNREQIRRVEELSDAYHLTLGGNDVTVAYLLEIERDRTSTT